MRKKLVTLAVGIMIASVLALPAFATPEGKARREGRSRSACTGGRRGMAKTFNQAQRDASKALHAAAKAARETFREP